MARRSRSEPESEQPKPASIGDNVTREVLTKFLNQVQHHETRIASERQALSQVWKDAEAAGINKKVAKKVFKLASEDPATIDLYVRSFTHYTTQLGLFDRVQEWKQAEANEANGASVAAASEPEPAHA